MHLLSEQQTSRRWRSDKGIGGLQLPKLTPPKLPDKTATETPVFGSPTAGGGGKSQAVYLQHSFAQLGVTEGNLYGPQKL